MYNSGIRYISRESYEQSSFMTPVVLLIKGVLSFVYLKHYRLSMALLAYVKYFFYIALNWNFRLAVFSIYHEIKGEKKYGIDTLQTDDLQQLTIRGQNLQHAEIYQGASYYLVENMFEFLRKMNAPDGFLDMGCGKGRALVVAAHFGFWQITGIDFARELCIEAEKNCRLSAVKFPSLRWQVHHAEASDYTIDGNIHIIFFFNPFDETVMLKVIKNILQSQKKFSRKMLIVYINPQHKNLFFQAGFEEIHYIKKMQYVEASLLERSG